MASLVIEKRDIMLEGWTLGDDPISAGKMPATICWKRTGWRSLGEIENNTIIITSIIFYYRWILFNGRNYGSDGLLSKMESDE
jgi:hypothetical protein